MEERDIKESKRYLWIIGSAVLYVVLAGIALVIDQERVLDWKEVLFAGFLQGALVTLLLRGISSKKYRTIVGLAGGAGFLFILAMLVAGKLFSEDEVIRVTNLVVVVYIFMGLGMSWGRDDWREYMTIFVCAFFVLCVFSSYVIAFLAQLL